MTARIFSPAKTAMQSGKGKTGLWVLEFDRATAKSIDPLMGYTSTDDTRTQVRLKFDTLEAATSYASRHGIDVRVEEPHEPKRRVVSYSDNFKFDRKIPWTH